MFKSTSLFGFIVLAISTLSGCATAPAADSGYLSNPEQLIENRERFPFQRVWVNPDTSKSYQDYKSIYIAPVNTDFLETMQSYKNYDEKSQAYLKQSASELAVYMRERFYTEMDAIESSEKNAKLITLRDLKLVDKSSKILEIAIVELVPTPAGTNRFTEAAGFFVPFLGLAKSLIVDDGSIAIEARVIDAVNKEILLQFADREEDKSTPLIDASDFTYFRHAKQHIDIWAKQYAKLLTTDSSETVSDDLIKLKPL